MAQTPPKTITLAISAALVILGIVLHENALSIAALDPHDFWLVVAGFVLLFLGVKTKNL